MHGAHNGEDDLPVSRPCGSAVHPCRLLQSHRTLPLAQLNFQSQFGTNYNLAFASYLLSLIPSADNPCCRIFSLRNTGAEETRNHQFSSDMSNVPYAMKKYGFPVDNVHASKEEAETLEILLEDPVSRVQVRLLYGVLEKEDIKSPCSSVVSLPARMTAGLC